MAEASTDHVATQLRRRSRGGGEAPASMTAQRASGRRPALHRRLSRVALVGVVLLTLSSRPACAGALATSRHIHAWTVVTDGNGEEAALPLPDAAAPTASLQEGVALRSLASQCSGDAWQPSRQWLGQSPWLLVRCWSARQVAGSAVEPGATRQLSLLRFDRVPEDPEDTVIMIGGLVVVNVRMFLGVAITVIAVAFAISGLRDLHRFVMIFARNMMEAKRDMAKHDLSETIVASGGGEKDMSEIDFPAEDEQNPKWSMLGIVGLCSLRFYTGFLSATWLPYLLAMEGQDLFGQKQALFMAMAKLLYGATILLNPIFGFIGDRAVTMSHGMGRRLFLRAGVLLAALGIYICVLAGREAAFLPFLSGILVWRLGEALNDVTTEALVPEMIPKEQFEVASAIKASIFLLGGLFGYVMLIMMANIHYSWLYYAYPLGMFTCVLPSIWLLDRDRLFPASQDKRRMEGAMEEKTFRESLWEAYISPAQLKGGFPLASLAVFLFGLGTSPMFFLLLIVRDLVGIPDPVQAQRQFSLASIGFFLAAAVASILAAVLDPSKKASPHKQLEERRQGVPDAEALCLRSKLLCIAMVFCGTFVAAIPIVVLWETTWARMMVFYVVCTLFGASFGVSFSLFQDLTWKCLPPDVNLACAMGFNVMCRLAGVGLGNCVCGIILDLSYSGNQNAVGEEGYNLAGYVIMCSLSGGLMLASTFVARQAVTRALQAIAEETGSPALH